MAQPSIAMPHPMALASVTGSGIMLGAPSDVECVCETGRRIARWLRLLAHIQGYQGTRGGFLATTRLVPGSYAHPLSLSLSIAPLIGCKNTH